MVRINLDCSFVNFCKVNKLLSWLKIFKIIKDEIVLVIGKTIDNNYDSCVEVNL